MFAHPPVNAFDSVLWNQLPGLITEAGNREDVRCVLIRAEGTSVYRVKDGSVQKVSVKTGVADGDWVAVEGELSAQDPVVVRGAETLHHGDTVTVIGKRKV